MYVSRTQKKNDGSERRGDAGGHVVADGALPCEIVPELLMSRFQHGSSLFLFQFIQRSEGIKMRDKVKVS